MAPLVQLTSENLAGFNDNGRYLDARAAAIRADIANLDEQIANLVPANQNDVLFNLGEDADSFDRQIAGLNLDGDSYRPIIDSLKERRKELNARLNTPAGEGERILDAITIIARKYCDALGVADYLDQDPKGILTRSLKDRVCKIVCVSPLKGQRLRRRSSPAQGAGHATMAAAWPAADWRRP